MPKQDEIIAVNAPTVEYYQEARSWSAPAIGVVYSISLANGMVLTSPRAFDHFKEPKPEPQRVPPHRERHE